MTLSIHKALLVQNDLEEAFIDFICRKGRGHFPLIHKRMNEVFESLPEQQGNALHQEQWAQRLYQLPGHNGLVDLDERLQIMQEKYWPDLPSLPIRWGKNPGARRLKSIRFGSYSNQPQPQITIHPRLRLSWIPMLFVDHVIHHELCHHAQHYIPLPYRRREAPHSSRFRAWEQQFTEYADALAWQRLRIKDLLHPH